MKRTFPFIVLFQVCCGGLQVAKCDLYSFKEVSISTSPGIRADCHVSKGQSIIDFAALSDNSGVVVITRKKNGTSELFQCKYGKDCTNLGIPLPAQYVPIESVAHPFDHTLYLLGKYSKTSKYSIISYNLMKRTSFEIFSDSFPLSSLLISPSKFAGKHRLFFARKKQDSTEIITVNETAQRIYPVISTSSFSADWFTEVYGRPATVNQRFGIPLVFHPTGKLMFWYNESGQIQALRYDEDNWQKPFNPSFAKHIPEINKWDRLQFSPNSLYLLAWTPGDIDATIYDWSLKKIRSLTFDTKIRSKITFTPDGKGILYIKNGTALAYEPLDLPLYDVENIWMYGLNSQDMNLFSTHGGLFRPTGYNQISQLYDSERYGMCGYFSTHEPVRPFLATTDPFHEILEAAFSGIFYIFERDVSMTWFNKLLTMGTSTFNEHDDVSGFWHRLFSNTLKISQGSYDDEELIKIKNAQGVINSPTLQNDNVNCAEFKPQG